MNKDLICELPVLETERLILRAVRLQDAEDMFEYAGDEENTKFMLFDTHTDIEVTRAFINLVSDKIKSGKCKDFVYEEKASGKVIGAGGAFDFTGTHCVNIGYILNKRYWGRGYAVEAAGAIIKYLFEKFDVHRIEAYHNAANVNSGKVMQKLGMTKEGTMKDRMFARGKYADAVYYGIINPKHKI